MRAASATDARQQQGGNKMNDRQILTRDWLVWFAVTGWALSIP